MTLSVFLGNFFSILATIADVWGSSRKSTRQLLWGQTVGQVFLAMSTFALRGYSALVQNIVSIIRNLTALTNKSSKILEYTLVVLGVVLGIVFNNMGLVGWFPILANLEYSVAIFRFKDSEILLKTALCICIILYTVFNLAISNYAGVVTNMAVLATTLISMFKGRQAKTKQ